MQSMNHQSLYLIKQLFFWSLFFVLGTYTGYAQNSKVADGIIAYKQGEFEKALQYFDQALEEEKQLKEKNIAKAYYYRAKSRLDVLQQAIYKKDSTKLSEYRDAPLASAKDLLMAESKDSKGQYAKAILLEQNLLYNPMIKEAIGSVQTANQRQSATEKEKAHTRARQYIEEAIHIKPQDYLPFDLLGQIDLAQQDSMAALFNFAQAIELYQNYPPQNPDFSIAYAYYRLAMLKLEYKKAFEEALRTLQYAQQLIQLEAGRLTRAKPAEEAKYQQALKDLKKYELELYRKGPANREEAISRYASAVKADPGDYDLHIAYAQLLEEVSPERAIAAYQKAIEVDASREIAHYNIGVLYYNTAKTFYDQAAAAKDLASAKAAKEKGEQLMRQSLSAFEAAHLANPKSKSSIRIICQVANLLEERELYQRYKLKEEQL